MTNDLTIDHKPLDSAHATRRYFAKFERIMGHLHDVAEITMGEGVLARKEGELIRRYLDRLSHTFRALSYKYLMSQRVAGALQHGMVVDRQDSGFPVFQELMTMANDTINVGRHLDTLPDVKQLKEEMVRHILNEQSHPTRLQYAMSQRLYYEELASQNLFFAGSDPEALWRGGEDGERRRYLIHWAAFDSQTNLPAIYLMECEDSGWAALPQDERRWPSAQAHLMAQAVSGLKLLTIAKGFDTDFPDLHPKKLRRVHIGPMYSHNFTQQAGPLREILAEASGTPGLDWALEWTVETLWSKDEEYVSTGWFSSAERQIFRVTDEAGQGATDIRRSLILPERPYQVLAHRDPESLRGVRRYVVRDNGRVIRYD
ncbi:MAG: hypothetical protein AAF393_10075 [Pseudomonadota bacterium]